MKNKLIIVLGALAVVAIAVIAVALKSGDEQEMEPEVTTTVIAEVTTSSEVATTSTSKVTVPPPPDTVTSKTLVTETKGTLAPNQERAKAYARDVLNIGFQRFSESLSPKDLVWARDKIAAKYPSLTMKLGGTESFNTIRLNGSIKACFIHDYTGPNGNSSVRETPC